MTQPPVVLVSVGNTRTRFALIDGDTLDPSICVENENLDAAAIAAALGGAEPGSATALIATVNPAVSNRLESQLVKAGFGRGGVLRFGRDVALPLRHALDDGSTLGHDRGLAAFAAFIRSRQACVVVDAGTAITVDFIDGDGTFCGGAILPGIRMMAEALHRGTAALPQVEVARPPQLDAGEGAPFGRDTASAIRLGVASAAIGAVHLLIDKYAEFYEAYPRVVATGGDAPMLFESDPLVESVVPDLVLIGMFEAWKRAIDADEDDDPSGDE